MEYNKKVFKIYTDYISRMEDEQVQTNSRFTKTLHKQIVAQFAARQGLLQKILSENHEEK
jgi:hypothetical protein